MVRQATPLACSLHADVLILDQSGRTFFRAFVGTADQTWRASMPSWKPRSTPISKPATLIQNRSDGPNLPTTSWHRSSASAAEQSVLTKQLHRNFRIGTLGEILHDRPRVAR